VAYLPNALPKYIDTPKGKRWALDAHGIVAVARRRKLAITLHRKAHEARKREGR
jgi:hypothetical protein